MPWVRILYSTEEDNLSPLDSKIACMSQSIHINNNKHVHRESQVRKSSSNGVHWAECLLITGMGYWVKVLTCSSIAQSVCQWESSLLQMWSQRRWVRILLSATCNLPVPEHRKLTTTHMYISRARCESQRAVGFKWAEWIVLCYLAMRYGIMVISCSWKNLHLMRKFVIIRIRIQYSLLSEIVFSVNILTVSKLSIPLAFDPLFPVTT